MLVDPVEQRPSGLLAAQQLGQLAQHCLPPSSAAAAVLLAGAHESRHDVLRKLFVFDSLDRL
jgi:hypothetical protein